MASATFSQGQGGDLKAKEETSVEKASDLKATAKNSIGEKGTNEIFRCQKYFKTGSECGFRCGNGCK